MELRRIYLNFQFASEIKKPEIEVYSKVIFALNKIYPLIVGVWPGHASLTKSNGSSVAISPTGVEFNEFIEGNLGKALQNIKSVMKSICERFNKSTFSNILFEAVGMSQASSKNWERELMHGLSIKTSDELKKRLGAKKFIPRFKCNFKHDKDEYALIVEPLFENNAYNFIRLAMTASRKLNLQQVFKTAAEVKKFIEERLSEIL